MAKYQKRPVIVEANQFFHKEIKPIGVRKRINDGTYYVKTVHGDEITLDDGDWVILELDQQNLINGYLAYPCKPDIFDKTYEYVLDD